MEKGAGTRRMPISALLTLTFMCLVKIRQTLSTESTFATSKPTLTPSRAIHRTNGPLDFIFDRITGWTFTEEGARPIKASKVALPPLSNDALD
jgi:hypothetical protein